MYGKNVLDSEIMAKIAKNLTELIGHTPLMELAEYSRKYGLKRMFFGVEGESFRIAHGDIILDGPKFSKIR